MSEGENDEGYEAGKEDLGVPAQAAGSFLDGCLTFVFPSLVIGLFVFPRWS